MDIPLLLGVVPSGSPSLLSNSATHASQEGISVLAFGAAQMQVSEAVSVSVEGMSVEDLGLVEGKCRPVVLSHRWEICTTSAQIAVHCEGMSDWLMS